MARIILTADVANLGGPGDIVEVKDGYARNYLLPRSLALVATKGAEKQVKTIRRSQEVRRIHDLDHAKQVKANLEGLGAVPLRAKSAAGSVKLFGSVTTADVAAAVKAAGGPVIDKRVISVSGHIKTVGMHTVHVRLHPDITADVTVEVSAAE
ncbi:MAG: 50S ribosomal protein L9 [Sciscionella sp.]